MQHLQPSTTLQGGKYRIERVLGQGGFGITYLATHMELQGHVAIKEFFMRDDCLREDNMSMSIPVPSKVPVVTSQLEKFKKEAQRLFSLQSEHIVKVYDMFEENSTIYYVMEYIDGVSLSQELQRKGNPFTEAEVKEYLVQTLDALCEIHRKGYEHLDIKPANLILNSRGCLKIIDFGASKQMSVDGGPTITASACCYTPGYAPSEQEGQFVKKFGPWTDFYALGATVYNLLTNNKPPRYLDIDEDGESAFSFSPVISPEMCKLILWMMAPKREQRPQSAEEILLRLKKMSPQDENISEDTILEVDDEATTLEQPKSQLPTLIQQIIDNMVHVDGGTFMMGRKTKWYEASDEEEHQVTLSSYSINKYEVTQEEWEAVMGNNPSNFKGAKLPVEQVSWQDCQNFISQLNSITGEKFRLPTEAEWEYAARGGQQSKFFKYSGGDNLNDVAWYEANSNNMTHPVGQKLPNELGLYDMSGNVWEWCNDWYGVYSSDFQINPLGAKRSPSRVNRGGGFLSIPRDCRSSNRDSNTMTFRSNRLGLRLAIDRPKEIKKRMLNRKL